MHVCVCHLCVGAQAGQKRALDFVELKLQMVASHPTGVLGILSSVRAVKFLNHWSLICNLFLSRENLGIQVFSRLRRKLILGFLV